MMLGLCAGQLPRRGERQQLLAALLPVVGIVDQLVSSARGWRLPSVRW